MTDLITSEILDGKNETIKSLMIQLQAMESHVKRTEAELAQARAACAALVEGKDAMEKCWKDARADAKAAVAVVVEKAVKEAETCRDVAVHDDDHAVGWRSASQAIAGGIRALAPEDAIAEVAKLRQEVAELRAMCNKDGREGGQT